MKEGRWDANQTGLMLFPSTESRLTYVGSWNLSSRSPSICPPASWHLREHGKLHQLLCTTRSRGALPWPVVACWGAASRRRIGCSAQLRPDGARPAPRAAFGCRFVETAGDLISASGRWCRCYHCRPGRRSPRVVTDAHRALPTVARPVLVNGHSANAR
jgi:hypothetical protein